MPTILTVDDSRMIRKAVTRVLQKFQCRIVEAEDGAVGLAQTVVEKPDLIILDYNMPVMDGVEMLKHLRNDPAIKSTKVIFLTANSGPEIMRMAVSLGVRDYILKPFNDDDLISKISRQVSLIPL
ncbi:MAG: response regulator [Novosphingobium sp.]|uniref:response regulator n=1 Tax=Novosphingobium sp. TaxID=1874826 RepID=UPI0030198ADF